LASQEEKTFTLLKERCGIQPTLSIEEFLYQCSLTPAFDLLWQSKPTSKLLKVMGGNIYLHEQIEEMNKHLAFPSPIVVQRELSESIRELTTFYSLLPRAISTIIDILNKDKQGNKWLDEIQKNGHSRRDNIETLLQKSNFSLDEFLLLTI
jgi:hypothetical protein